MSKGNRLRDIRKNEMPFKQMQPGQQVQVDLKDATQQVCECGCKYFEGALTLYKVSAITSPNGQELMAQQPVLICKDCRKPFGEKEVKDGK